MPLELLIALFLEPLKFLSDVLLIHHKDAHNFNWVSQTGRNLILISVLAQSSPDSFRNSAAVAVAANRYFVPKLRRTLKTVTKENPVEKFHDERKRKSAKK